MDGLVDENRFGRPFVAAGPAAGIGDPVRHEDESKEQARGLHGEAGQKYDRNEAGRVDGNVQRQRFPAFELIFRHPVGLSEIVADHVSGENGQGEGHAIEYLP